MRELILMLWVVLMVGSMGAGAAPARTDGPVVFYAQLIRGTDDGKPPTKESKRIGSKLSGQLRPVFAWKHYWETHCAEVKISPGQKARVRLNPEREVEIDLREAGRRKLTAFSNGRLVATTTESLHAPMSIIGGERADKTAWFIVVRRDKPSVE